MKISEIIWVLGFCLILNIGCKSHVKDSKNLRADFSTDTESPQEVADTNKQNEHIEILPLKKNVDPDTLKTEVKNAKTDLESKNNSLVIEVVPDQDSDYIQFAVCPKNSLENCSPTLQDPYSFANDSHVFPNPPAGEINIFLRSCVSKNRADQYKTSCGKWEQMEFEQPDSYDKELRALLVEKYKESQTILEECKNIHSFMERYKEKNPNGTGDLDSIITNFLNHVSPESCKEIMLLEDWSLLNKYASKSSSIPATEIVSEDISILLTLGVPLMIAGLISTGVGFYSHYRYDPKYATFLLQHKNKFVNLQTNYKKYYFSEIKDVDFQLKRIQAHNIAIQNKIKSLKPDHPDLSRWIAESTHLQEETKYLETYKNYFVTDHTKTSILKSSREYNNLTIRDLSNNFEKIQKEIATLKKIPDSDNSVIILNNELKKMQQAYDRNYKSIASQMPQDSGSPWKKWADLTASWDNTKFANQIEFSKPISTFLAGSEINGALRKTGAIAATIGGIMIMVEAFSLSESAQEAEAILLKNLSNSYSKINASRNIIYSN